MKKVRVSISLAAVAVGVVVFGLAVTAQASSGVTAGDLSRQLSDAARSVGAGKVSERLSGFAQGKGSSSAVTEGAAVAMLQKAGYAATTSHPDRPLTSERAGALVQQFRTWAVGQGVKKDLGSKKGTLPDEVDSCFDESNHGQCITCCKDLGGTASTCAKACMIINKPSPSEPIP